MDSGNSEKKKFLDELSKEIDRKKEFLARAAEIVETVYVVQIALDDDKDYYKAVELLPEDEADEIVPNIRVAYQTKSKGFHSMLPQLPPIEGVSLSPVSSSGTASVFINSLDSLDYEIKAPVMSVFTTMAERNAKRLDLGKLLEQVDYKLAPVYLEAVKSFEKSKSRTEPNMSVIKNFRALVQQFWGSLALWARAKCGSGKFDMRLELKKDKHRSWVSNCLSGTGEESLLERHLYALYTLHCELSPGAKNPEAAQHADIPTLYAKLTLIIQDCLGEVDSIRQVDS
jgi:hypothetical protein